MFGSPGSGLARRAASGALASTRAIRAASSPRRGAASARSLADEMLEQYAAERIPLPWELAGRGEGASGGPLDADLSLAIRLRHRLSLLLAAEPDVRATLACWAGLQAGLVDGRVEGAREGAGTDAEAGRLARAPRLGRWRAPSPASRALADEWGAWLLTRSLDAEGLGEGDLEAVAGAARGEGPPWGEDVEARLGAYGEAIARLAREGGVDRAEAIAQATLGGTGSAFADPQPLTPLPSSPPSPLRFVPFEWLYEGMGQLSLPETLGRGRGAVPAMAAVAVAAARRAGLAAWAAPAVTRLPEIDPDVRELKASMKKAAVGLLQEREHTHWVLEVDNGDEPGESDGADARGEPGESDGADAPPPLPSGAAHVRACASFVDVASGRALSPSALAAAHPYYAPSSALDPPARPRLWRGAARLAVEGLQRRGEADDVARWLYVVLALDADAPEWTAFLGQDA